MAAVADVSGYRSSADTCMHCDPAMVRRDNVLYLDGSAAACPREVLKLRSRARAR